MQIQGVGNNHNANMHQVTTCLHDHSETKKVGDMKAAPSSGNAAQDASNLLQQDGQMSLAAWLRNTLSSGKRFLFKIWGDGSDEAKTAGIKGENTLQSGKEAVTSLKESETDRNGNIAGQEAASSMAVPRQQTLQNNPYFSTVEDTDSAKQSVWKKMRVRFHSLTGQLRKQFSGKNSFQTKQGKPKEDLRKHSRYREDDLEIDCILTDDSYLLDSYDRKGEYSKLSAKK